MADNYLTITTVANVRPGKTLRLVFAGHPALVVSADSRFYAVGAVCTKVDAS